MTFYHQEQPPPPPLYQKSNSRDISIKLCHKKLPGSFNIYKLLIVFFAVIEELFSHCTMYLVLVPSVDGRVL